MRIRQEILEYPDWFKTNDLIEELDETMEEFIQRQEYVVDLINAHVLLNQEIDWETFNQFPNESKSDFSMRVLEMHHCRIEVDND